MYIYLGQDTVISTADILGIFDIENTSTSRITRDYLKAAQQRGEIVEVSAELPKSYVVCQRGGKVSVYLSQISPSTLKKRARYIKDLSLH